MFINKHLLKASTIVEVIIAMVIIMITFGVSITLFTQLQGSQSNHVKAKALLCVRTITDRAKAGYLQMDTNVQTPLYVVVARITPPPSPDSLWFLQVQAKTPAGFLMVEHVERYTIPLVP